MAKTRIKRGNKVYVYERENYRDEFGKVKHGKAQYLGIEETIDGKTRIIPPKRRQKDIEITSSVRYGDILSFRVLKTTKIYMIQKRLQ